MSVDAAALHAAALTIDASCVFPELTDEGLRRLTAGGVDCVSWTAATPAQGGHDFERTAARFAAVRLWARREPHRLRLIERASQLEAAKAAGATGVVLALQDALPVRDDLALLDVLFELGLRVLQPVYTEANLVGSGCGERTDGGLTFFGRDLVRRCAELGVVVDVSHAGDATSADIVAAIEGPVVATHANARAVCDTPRNKSDDLIRAIAASGGVIGVALPSSFVSRQLPTDLAAVIDHIVYLADLVGTDHVGLGLDSLEFAIENPSLRPGLSRRWHERRPDIFGPESASGGYWPLPEGIDSVEKAPAITAALLDRGFTECDIESILGLNWARVFSEVWR